MVRVGYHERVAIEEAKSRGIPLINAGEEEEREEVWAGKLGFTCFIVIFSAVLSGGGEHLLDIRMVCCLS